MLPRLMAEFQLILAEVIMIPHLKERAAKKILRSIKSRASGGSGVYDAQGNLIIQNSNQLRAWFVSIGHASSTL